MDGQATFAFQERPTSKGFPELQWAGKRPYCAAQYFPAQIRERYGKETEGWINKIFWGDNLQVMGHLLREFQGKMDLVYIDPPFDSKAVYKKTITVKGTGRAESSRASFAEKQYSDIWANDEYLQFMLERLTVLKHLLSDTGSIFLHCDYHKSHHLRCLLDMVFGPENFVNEIVWGYKDVGGGRNSNFYKRKHDTIFWYAKTGRYKTNEIARAPLSQTTLERFGSLFDESGVITYRRFQEMRPTEFASREKQGRVPEDLDAIFLSRKHGRQLEDYWTDIQPLRNRADKDHPNETFAYPTQKPEALLERIIRTVTAEGDLVFDCFMGSGTTQAVAMKLGRRFLGADMNLGAVQATTKRLLSAAAGLAGGAGTAYTGFEVYTVNNYDLFRNPVEARSLLLETLGIQPFPRHCIWDGELDGRMVKIMPFNRIAAKADLEDLIAALPCETYEKRREENASRPVESITLVCMGHEPDLKASLEQALPGYPLDIEIVDILRDKPEIQLKREAEADIAIECGRLVIRAFYPLNLMQKLSLQRESVEDWRQLVESVMIDWDYDGAVMQPAVTDIPEKNEMVAGIYEIPENHGVIKVKITDLLSETLEAEVR